MFKMAKFQCNSIVLQNMLFSPRYLFLHVFHLKGLTKVYYCCIIKKPFKGTMTKLTIQKQTLVTARNVENNKTSPNRINCFVLLFFWIY